MLSPAKRSRGITLRPPCAVVSVIPFRVWLCSNTDEVTSQLFCYVEQTKAIVAAMPRVTDQDRLNFVSRLAEEDVVFCDNPYFTGLRDGSEYVPYCSEDA